MNKSRVLLHPLLTNKRSLSVLIMFFLCISGVTAYAWWKIFDTLAQARITIYYFNSTSPLPLLSFLLSPFVHAAAVLFSVLIAAATTAMSIVGPVKRIEQWLIDWEMGYSISPLQSRIGDTYDNLIRLMNDLYTFNKSKINPPPPPS